jgi:hypothetical protein
LTPSPATIILHHGTTLHRAQRIIVDGPDAYYVEPGSGGVRAEPPEFSTTRLDHPVALGRSERYARGKALNFPNEGGPVILEMEVPAHVIAILEADPIAAGKMASGDTCFDDTVGIRELLAAWLSIPKRIIPI